MPTQLISFTIVLTAMVLWSASIPANAAERVALVIGNTAYSHVPALANPRNDAEDVEAALERLDFAVTRLEDADYSALRQGLLEFTRAAAASEVAVVFYAGHGLEVDRRNFLVPVDARLVSDQDVEFETVPLELVLRAVERAAGFRLVILDACRENPFAALMQRAGATRAIGRGLARVEPAGETLVAYAAKEGTLAADGEARNSPYTRALLEHLEEPGLEVGLMFRRVRDAVLAATGGRQEPFVYGSLSSRGIFLAAQPSVDPQSVTATESDASRMNAEQLAAERRFWQSVEHSGNLAELDAYLERYPTGLYATLARHRRQQLAARQQDASPPESVGDVEAPIEGSAAAPPATAALLQMCERHFAANRLTTGVGGTAVACYQEVLARDPANMDAIDGLQRVFDRYAEWARVAIERGEASVARGYVEKLEGLNPEAPITAGLRQQIAGLAKPVPDLRVDIQTEPDDARVRFPRIGRDYAPDLALAPGTYEVDIRRKGYRATVTEIVVSPSSTKFAFVLERDCRTVQVSKDECRTVTRYRDSGEQVRRSRPVKATLRYGPESGSPKMVCKRGEATAAEALREECFAGEDLIDSKFTCGKCKLIDGYSHIHGNLHETYYCSVSASGYCQASEGATVPVQYEEEVCKPVLVEEKECAPL